MQPVARSEQLLVQEVGDELVVYDQRSHRAHRLNGTARTVWRLADGSRSVGELAVRLRDELRPGERAELGIGDSEALVRLALDDLARAGLLARSPRSGGIEEATSRRQILTAAAALLTPVIATIVAPTPADAQSFPTTPRTSSSSSSSSTSSSSTTLVTMPESFNGLYMGTGTLRPQQVPGTCEDENFPTTVNVRGELSLNTGAENPWIKTHLPSTVFAFESPDAVVQSDNSLLLTATGTFSPGGFFNYRAVEAYTITGNMLVGTQTFTLSVCTWVYDINMTRQ